LDIKVIEADLAGHATFTHHSRRATLEMASFITPTLACPASDVDGARAISTLAQQPIYQIWRN